MPRGRPANKEKLAAKKAEEERLANMTQDQIEAEQEQKEKEKDAATEARVTAMAEAREKKAAKSAAFKKLGEAQREKVKNLDEVAKKAYYAKRNAASKVTRKRIQGDLIFPVKSIKKNLKGFFGMKRVYKNNRKEHTKIQLDSAIFTAAVIEYLTAEVLELSGECSKAMRKSRIVPRHIMSAVRMDDELNVLFPRSTTISMAGVLPKPMPSFLIKNNVPRSQWTAGPNEIFRESAISAPSRKSQTGKNEGGNSEVNNNK